MTSIDELVRAAAQRGVEDALAPVLRRLVRPEKRTYTYADAADVIGCSDRHVAKLVGRGLLPLVPHMGARRLIPRLAVEAFVDGREMPVSSLSSGGDGDGTSISELGRAAS